MCSISFVNEINTFFENTESSLRYGFGNFNGDPINKKKYTKVESIVNGMSGLLFSLISTYEPNKNSLQLSCIERIANDIYKFSIKNEIADYSFSYGKAGVIFVFAQAYRATSEKQYVEYALDLLHRGVRGYIQSDFVDNTFSRGRAGLIFSLSYLYSLCKRNELLTYIKEGILSSFHRVFPIEDSLVVRDNFIKEKLNSSIVNGDLGLAIVYKFIGEKFKINALEVIAKRIINYYWQSECNLVNGTQLSSVLFKNNNQIPKDKYNSRSLESYTMQFELFLSELIINEEYGLVEFESLKKKLLYGIFNNSLLSDAKEDVVFVFTLLLNIVFNKYEDERNIAKSKKLISNYFSRKLLDNEKSGRNGVQSNVIFHNLTYLISDDISFKKWECNKGQLALEQKEINEVLLKNTFPFSYQIIFNSSYKLADKYNSFKPFEVFYKDLMIFH